ncbi:MAG: flavin reductase family protein [Negativicutes bacterium]
MQKEIGKNAFIYPMPLVLVGTKDDDKVNFMAVGWVARVNNQPPLFAIAINNGHLTNETIRKTGEFSINGVSAAQKDVADYCGMNSGRKIDKGALFETVYGDLKNAPLIADAPYSLTCKLTQTIDLPTNTLFIGEIVNAYCKEECMTDGKPDLAKIDQLIFTMPDLKYYSCGETIGKAWSDGTKYKK